MKKFSFYFFLLVLLTGLVLYRSFYPPQPATALAPAALPEVQTGGGTGAGPNETLCHLAANEGCTIINELDIAASETGPRRGTYPAMGAQEVPTYTLVSATFEREMEANSLTPETFYLTQGGSRIAGSIRYIPMSQMAVFEPAEPLKPATVYTATLSPEIRDVSSQPLGESWVWSFTTTSAVSPLRQGVAAAALGGMNIYFGDLHSHTGYSDGAGTPAQAFATARANGSDFYAVTEHDFMMTQAEWQDIQNRANAATVNGQFVAIAGFEYSNNFGHINVFDSETYVSVHNPNYDTFSEFYSWLANHPTAFAQFNHPQDNAMFNWNFNDFAFHPQADLKVVLQELQTADQFFLGLNKGWHLGTVKNHDTHQPDWGFKSWMGVAAPSLTRQAILDSLRARRTFFVSPSDSNLALVMQANGYWMGSAIPNTGKINLTVVAYDPDPKGKPLRINIYDRGVRVAGVTLPSAQVYTWTPTIPGKLGHYYYAEAFYDGWLYPAYSSPIWVERPPLAEAGANQIVTPGATVKLSGLGSFEPDGDALTYRWVQESGPAITLVKANTAQPSFVASSPGQVVLRLTVTDPGRLSAVDRTTVTVTNQPILAISKSGPRTAGPDGKVTYILTVTNKGSTTANNVQVTDTLPNGATYFSGGSLKGNIVSWSGLTIPPNGGKIQVGFMVVSQRPIVNFDYQASCANCIGAQGTTPVFTNWGRIYLPLLLQ